MIVKEGLHNTRHASPCELAILFSVSRLRSKCLASTDGGAKTFANIYQPFAHRETNRRIHANQFQHPL